MPIYVYTVLTLPCGRVEDAPPPRASRVGGALLGIGVAVHALLVLGLQLVPAGELSLDPRHLVLHILLLPLQPLEGLGQLEGVEPATEVGVTSGLVERAPG